MQSLKASVAHPLMTVSKNSHAAVARTLKASPRRFVPLRAVPEPDADRLASQITRRGSLSMLGASLLLPSVALVPAEPAAAGLKSYSINPDAPIEEVTVNLGTAENEMVFDPPELTFTQGKVYKLHMHNPSNVNHYFTAVEFADKIYTILVENGDATMEVKGKVQEVELDAGASLTWIFVPMRPGKYPLKCPVKGHTEAGMVGSITIVPAV